MNDSDHIKAAYYHLCRVRPDHGFRSLNQDVYAKLRDEVADISDLTPEQVQERYGNPTI